MVPIRWTLLGFLALWPMCRIHLQAHTHTPPTWMSVGTCLSVYLANGGVFERDSFSTSQGLAVCQTFICLSHQMKHGLLGLWAWLARCPMVSRSVARGNGICERGKYNQTVPVSYIWNVYICHKYVHIIDIMLNMSFKATTPLLGWIFGGLKLLLRLTLM